MDCSWKPNWEETKRHFVDWWNGKGLVLGSPGWWGTSPASTPHEILEEVTPAASREEFHTDALRRARYNHWSLSVQAFPADVLPVSETEIGPGSMALLLGSEPGFSETTVWYHPCMKDEPEPERLPPLRFDPGNKWWKVHEATLRACAELAGGRYAVGCPDLIENVDTLASLRDAQTLLVDMIERPDWVGRKLAEINRAWFEVYDRIYEIIRLEDGSAVFGAFRLWAPGKVAKVQCDAAAMFSPDMFRRFVVPALAEQCEWLDYSMFHLDGHECMCHLDALLAIEALDAIEWTPDPNVPPGGDPEWYCMYRRILQAGKSVQAVGVRHDEVVPLLDAVGGAGMYVLTRFDDEAAAEKLAKEVEQYR